MPPTEIELAIVTERVANLIDRYERSREEDKHERELDRAQLNRIEGQTRMTNGRVTVVEGQVATLEQSKQQTSQGRSRLWDRLIGAAVTLSAAGVGALAAHFLG